jgi:rod shape-determining protein MreD
MNNTPLHRLLTFVLLVLLQCFIFSRLPLGTYVHPCIYILFILFLPFGYSRIVALLWAFMLGLAVDLLSTDIVGINAASLVALAYVRPYLLKLFSIKSDFDAYIVPSSATIGWRLCTGYVLLATLIHQLVFFFLDTFGFYDVMHTFLRILLSTLVSALFILLLQKMLPGNRKNNE